MPIPEPGPRVPRRGGKIRSALGRFLLRLLGWRIEGTLPDVSKMVIIVAPHSSNWDFLIGVGLKLALRLDASFLGKSELFRWPLGPVMRWLGGIPVDRNRPDGVVQAALDMFAARSSLILAMAPEGTRKPVDRWKTGFHRIASGAGVPIVPGYFDNRTKRVGFGAPFTATADAERDMAALRAFYADKPRR